MVGGKFVPSSVQMSTDKISRVCGAISSLSLDLSPLNLASYLILKLFFRQCRWLFAYSSL